MDKATGIKLIILAAAWLNTLLVRKGYDPLPAIDETDAALVVTCIVSVYTAIAHQFIGRKGKEQKEQLKKTGLENKIIK